MLKLLSLFILLCCSIAGAEGFKKLELQERYFGDDLVQPPISKVYAKEIWLIEKYLNSYQTLMANFKQSNGKISYGKLMIAKPGRIRCEYLTPSKLLLIIKGAQVTFYDYDLDEASYASMETSAFRILSADNINFSELNMVEFEKSNQHLAVSVKEYNLELKQNLLVTFKFSYPEIALKQINVTTEENQMQMIFEQIIYNQPMSEKLFQFNRKLIKERN